MRLSLDGLRFVHPRGDGLRRDDLLVTGQIVRLAEIARVRLIPADVYRAVRRGDLVAAQSGAAVLRVRRDLAEHFVLRLALDGWTECP